MKNLFLSFVFISLSLVTFSQDYSTLKSISLQDSLECKKAEPQVMECSNYLLSKPCIEDLNSLNAISFLMKWMEQTPEYSFSFDRVIFKSIDSDLMLSGRYIACQVKTAINDKPKSYNKDFESKYITQFLEYCENPQNKVKVSSKINKLIKAKNAGKLNEEL